MFPFYNQQSFPFYQQQTLGNHYWPISQQQYQVQQSLNSIPQYYQNVYLNYNVYPEVFKPIINPTENLTPIQTQTQNRKTFSCNCINTDCRKQYCICFKNGEICAEKCGCSSCRNKKQSQRNTTFQKKKNVTCNCKKSQCVKKYCQCYANGIKCGQGCHCQECKNN